MSWAAAAAQTRKLAGASARLRERIVHGMTPTDMLRYDASFENWAHESQHPPPGQGWRTWLMMAGRGFGKTRAGAEWIHALASGKSGVRIALVGASLAEARSIMVEGVSGLLAVADHRGEKIGWEPSLGRLTWRNGSTAQIFSGDHPDGLRGPEHDFAWCDELAKWRDAEEAWDNLQLGLRRGPRPRALITTTPRPLQLLETIEQREWTVTTRGRTSDNINLDQKVVDIMIATYGGTRKGRQELDGELILDVEGSLWPRALIARCRCGSESLPTMERIVVGVDPPAGPASEAGQERGGDSCGIVVAGVSGETYYVLEDSSVRGLSPEGWSSRVAAAAARWGASLIVAEANNGGEMVKSVLKNADSGLNVRLVHAVKGKAARAEPVALLFERGKAQLAGQFGPLEDELAAMVAGETKYRGPGRSPDRADAMVWALTALSESRSGVPRVRGL